MSTSIVTEREHSLSPMPPELRLIDRIALHGGLALIRWAQRAEPGDPGEERRHAARVRTADAALASAVHRRENVVAERWISLIR